MGNIIKFHLEEKKRFLLHILYQQEISFLYFTNHLKSNKMSFGKDYSLILFQSHDMMTSNEIELRIKTKEVRSQAHRD